jgi:hypothetical protein
MDYDECHRALSSLGYRLIVPTVKPLFYISRILKIEWLEIANVA